MARFVARRLLFLIPTLVGLSLITFTISHVIPGDPAAALAGGPFARPKQLEALRRKYGFDKPLHEQYFLYMNRLLHGDLGMSTRFSRPVTVDIKAFGPATAELALVSFAIVCLVGIPLGIVSAMGRGRLVDHLSRLGALMGVAAPAMWVALMAQLILFRNLRLLPFGRRIDIDIGPPQQITGLYIIDSVLTGNMPALMSSLHHIILPALVLALSSTAYLTRMQRASLLEVLTRPYILVARAKGLTERKVVLRHALKNSLLPVITLLGMSLGGLLGGSFIIETIFAWPGLGSYTTSGILFLDFNSIMGVVLVMAVVYVLLNLMVDIAYSVLDPRIGRE